MNKLSRLLSFLTFALLAIPASAFAEGAAAVAKGDASGFIAIGAGLAVGLGAMGGGMGQGRAIGYGLEGISRNPSASGKVFVPMIVGLVLIESLVILSFVIAITLTGKV